jgi:hypothetical protein
MAEATDTPRVDNSASTGSRLPADVPWSGAQSGIGLKPDLETIAGISDINGIFNRPARAIANDAKFDHGIIAEGRMDGEVDTCRYLEW